MTILQFALAFAFGLLVAAAAGACLWIAAFHERPALTASWLVVGAWWLGQGLAAVLLFVLAGGILGAVARAAWLLVGG